MNGHLEILRDEHVQLQRKFAELQKKYDILSASATANCERPEHSPHSFIEKLVITVAGLFNKPLYSDITVYCDGHQLWGHRLVIATRTDYWSDLSMLDRIDLNDIPYNVGCTMLKWMYTGFVDPMLGDVFTMDVLSAAILYRLDELRERCETMLIGRLEVTNCAKLYQFSEEMGLIRLRDKCTRFVSTRWNDFSVEHFAELSASLLYRMLKSRCKHLIHSIVRLRREDVLFLFFIDHDAKLWEVSNELDDDGVSPLQLALDPVQIDIASSLVAHHADVNCVDSRGKSLLMTAVEKGQVAACEFLAANGAHLDFVVKSTGETLLHTLARSRSSSEMLEWFASKRSKFNVNVTDSVLRSALAWAIEADNERAIDFLLQSPTVDTNLTDRESRSPLSLALFSKKDVVLGDKLVKAGANVNAFVNDGRNLLHHAVQTNNFIALQFLCKNLAEVNATDNEGRSALHLAAIAVPPNLDAIRLLLKAGADPSVRVPDGAGTILHVALDCDEAEEILNVIVSSTSREKLELAFLAKDANEETVLARATLRGKRRCAEVLLKAGADVNERSGSGDTLLARAIQCRNDLAAVFLLDRGADAAIRTPDGKSGLQLAVEFGLLETVRCLCKAGANVNSEDPLTGLPVLWTAIENGAFGVASVLVEHGCDLNSWAPASDESSTQTMLHRAIDFSLTEAAVFLIENGCEVNVLKRYNDGTSGDQQTPLHSCILWNLEEVALCLIKNGARVDVQDADGRTAVHLAVQERNGNILMALLAVCESSSLLLRDRYGVSPLALAMHSKNNLAAEAIVSKAPHAAVQMNGSGENLLHSTVKAADLECVLFLLALLIDVNVCTQDASRVTALHICAQSGNEIIMRNLILAGAEVNALSAKGYTPLHIAAYNNHNALCLILLENGALANAVDHDGNNALHAAVSQGSVSAVKVLLTESQIDIRALNKKQQTPLILAASSAAASSSADILQMFLSVDPQYPVDSKDSNGNTLFLLAYMNGSAELCKALLRTGVCLAVTNYFGTSVFNFETPTKQLLFSLLDSLEMEPKWADGDVCSECDAKFTLTMRKHHCRHCGRLVCARCSEHAMPIIKYDLQKAVRVCQICTDVLTMGYSQ